MGADVVTGVRVAELDGYTGPDSIRAAGERVRLARAAADMAERAGRDELVSALAAREAERRLGLMLLAGREAGDIAPQSPGSLVGDVNRPAPLTLADLGVQRNLGSDAAAFASIPDDVWSGWLQRADAGRASHRAFSRAAHTYRAQHGLRGAPRTTLVDVPPPPPRSRPGSRRKPAEIAESFAATLAGLAVAADDLAARASALPPDVATVYADRYAHDLRSITRLIRTLRELT
jgi:hypothetical protein